MRAALAAIVCLAACAAAPPGPAAPNAPDGGGAQRVPEAAPDGPPDAPGQDAQACGAQRFAALLGQPFTPELRARLPREGVRIIRPGEAVTLDYAPLRLNVELDRAGRVARIVCG